MNFEQRLKDVILPGRLGLISNPSAVDGSLRSTAEFLKENYRLQAVFGPEHGIRGDAQAGEKCEGGAWDSELGVKSYSLYGDSKKPSPAMLEDIDAMVFDIQDVGARFYTYIYTMAYAMEACAEKDIPFTVLDRPNPINGQTVEGISIEPKLDSFVGAYALTARYGLTIGELAQYINGEYKLGCRLQVIPWNGWERHNFYGACRQPWIMPSPNIPTMDAALTYIGTCLLEGTSLSEGRGTTRPFEIVGSPDTDARLLANRMNAHELPGVMFRPMHFTPTFSKFTGQLCHGVQLHITDRRKFRPFATGLWLFHHLWELNPNMEFLTPHFDRILGTDALRTGRKSTEDILLQARKDSAEFKKMSRKYKIYE